MGDLKEQLSCEVVSESLPKPIHLSDNELDILLYSLRPLSPEVEKRRYHTLQQLTRSTQNYVIEKKLEHWEPEKWSGIRLSNYNNVMCTSKSYQQKCHTQITDLLKLKERLESRSF